MTPDEVRMLDNRYALLFIRGERPVLDEKFDILKHPNLALSADGKGKPYLHGEVTEAVATIRFDGDFDEAIYTDETAGGYELLLEEEIEALLKQEEDVHTA